AVDVTAQVALHRNTNVRPGGHADLDVEIAAQRSRLVIMFQTRDSNEEIGSCVPNTKLRVTPDTAGNRGGTTIVTPGSEFALPLPSGASKLHLDIAVSNVRDDVNCARQYLCDQRQTYRRMTD